MSTLLLILLLVLTPQSHAKKGDPPPASWYVTEANKAALSDANSLLAQKKFADAAAAYEVVRAKEPECGLVLVGLAKARIGEGKPAEAVPLLEKASTLFADKVDAWIPYSQALLGAQQHPRAVEAARKAIELRPSSVDALWVAHQGLVAQKDYAGAHTLLAEARTRGWMPVLDCMDGLVYVAEGKREPAVEMQGKCRDFRPWSDQLAAAVSGMPGAPAAPPAPDAPPAPPAPAAPPKP